MITVFGEGRGFRVVWLLEEMGIPYRLRPVEGHKGMGRQGGRSMTSPGWTPMPNGRRGDERGLFVRGGAI